MTTKYLIAEIEAAGGLYGTKNQSKIPAGGLIVAEAITLSEGGFRKEGGSARFNTATAVLATDVDVIGGVNWFPMSDLPRQIVVGNNGTVYRATGTSTGAFTSIATGLNSNVTRPVFVTAGAEQIGENRKLFLFNGYNSPRYVDGDATSLATMTTPPSDWSDTSSGAPSFGAHHDGRLYAGGNANDPHRLYYSTASDHLVTDGTLGIYPGEGQKLVGAASFKGYLIAWKYPRGIYYVDSSDPTITNWRIERQRSRKTDILRQAYCMVENDIVFLDAAGDFHMLSIVQATSKEASNLSRVANFSQWMRDNVDLSQISNARMIYYGHRQEVHCAVASVGSTVNNLRIIIDFNGESPRFITSSKDICQSMWITKDSGNIERPTVGDDTGGVWLLDQDARTKDGTGYNGEFRTAYSNFGYLDPTLATQRKNLGWLELVVNPTGNFDMSIDVHIDGELSQTVNFDMGVDGAALGSFTLDTDELAGEYLLAKKRRLTGSGNFISFAGSNTADNTDFDVSHMYVYFSPGTDRP